MGELENVIFILADYFHWGYEEILKMESGKRNRFIKKAFKMIKSRGKK